MNLIGCVDGEGDSPEAVVLGALEVVELQLPRLAELVSFDVEPVIEGLVEGDV